MFQARSVLLTTCVRSGISKQRLHLRACKAEEGTAVILSRIQKAVGIPPPCCLTHTEVDPCKHGLHVWS